MAVQWAQRAGMRVRGPGADKAEIHEARGVYQSCRAVVPVSRHLTGLYAGALAAGTALADVSSDQPVKDSYITTKVKAELAKDKGTSALHIHVTTKDGMVMLDGVVRSKAEKELAGKGAEKVD
jgi:osmotically-inducible protein OsmY